MNGAPFGEFMHVALVISERPLHVPLAVPSISRRLFETKIIKLGDCIVCGLQPNSLFDKRLITERKDWLVVKRLRTLSAM